MSSLLDRIKKANRSLAILIDPDKIAVENISNVVQKITARFTKYEKELSIDQFFILAGGSTMRSGHFNDVIEELATLIKEPIIIFPGDYEQLSNHAHGILFLNLISGRNPDYLIGQQLRAVPQLNKSSLEIIPTAYLLIDGGTTSAVQRVTKTVPLPIDDVAKIINTALAGQYMGNQLIYLEAGSGAINPVAVSIIKEVKKATNIPIIAGGGLKTSPQLEERYSAGASLLVIGTHIEKAYI